MRYYTINRILEKNAHYNIIFGERSAGKTYSTLEYALKQYVKTGKQFAYIRRMAEDIVKKRMLELFSALSNNRVIEKVTKGEYNSVYYYSGRFFLCFVGEAGEKIKTDERPLGYAFALSQWERNKAPSYPNITTIIFDEFITRDTYLKDEFVIFCNTLSSIIRERNDVKIFLLGNTINKYGCPYFKEMGLKNVDKMEQGTIDLYKYGDSGLLVAVEFCGQVKAKKKSNIYFAFDNPKLSMIKSGAWELDIYPHCPVKILPKHIKHIAILCYEGYKLQLELCKVDRDYFLYIHNKTTEIKNIDTDLIYTLEHSHKRNYRRNILKPITPIEKTYANLIILEKVFYQDNEVGEIFRNYLNFCRN